MGLCVTRFPCIEAVVKHAFSHLKIIIAKRKQQMLNDLLGALMFLRTNEHMSETVTLAGFWVFLEEIALAEQASDYQGECPSQESLPEEDEFRENAGELPRCTEVLIPSEMRIRAQTLAGSIRIHGRPT
jgi:hypothetical protein